MEDFLNRRYGKMKRIATIVFVIALLGLIAGTVILLLIMLQPSVDLMPQPSVDPRSDAEEYVAGMLCMLVFVIPLLATGIILLRFRSIETWPPYRAAISEKESIVWVYFITAEIQAAGLPVGKKQGIAFCNRDGKRFELGMSKKDREALQPVLEAHFPQATIGWSRELYEQYKSNPASLIRT